jgi:hypothetical protein
MSKPSIDLSKLYKPHPRQVLFHESPHKGRLFGGAIRGGKTVAGVRESIQLCLDYPGNVGIVARQTLPALKKTVLVEFEKYEGVCAMDNGRVAKDANGKDLRLITQHHATDHYFQFYNGSRIWYTSLGDDKAGLAAQMGTTIGFFFIDQIEECSEAHFNNLLGRLSLNLPGIKLKYILTANPMPGWVKDRFILNSPKDFIYIPSLPKDNPYLPANYEAELRETYPAELVRAWLEGDWNVMETGNFVFNFTEINRASDKELSPEGEKYMGVDLAWGGGDENVAIIRQGGKVLTFERWIYPAEESIRSVDKIIDLLTLHEIKPQNCNVDAVSGGNPICSEIIRRGYRVNSIIAGEKADDETKYINKRAEMYFQLRGRFRDNLISIPDDRTLKAQLSTIRYKPAQEKRMQIISKEEMRKAGEKSPDRADALALSFYEAKVRNPNIRWLG